jgi:hypothetical protein
MSYYIQVNEIWHICKLIEKVFAEKNSYNFKSTPLTNTAIGYITLSRCVIREIGCGSLNSFQLVLDEIRTFFITVP